MCSSKAASQLQQVGEREGNQPPVTVPIFIAVKCNHLCSLSSLFLLQELATKAACSKERQESRVIAEKNVTSETRCQARAGKPTGHGETNRPSLREEREREQSQKLVQLCFLKQSEQPIPSAGNDLAPAPSSRSRSSTFCCVKTPLCERAARLALGTGRAGSCSKKQIARGGKVTPGVLQAGATPELAAVAMPSPTAWEQQSYR